MALARRGRRAYEPASELLARIRAEREARETEAKAEEKRLPKQTWTARDPRLQ